MSTSGEIAARWISLNTFHDKPTLVQVMAWSRKATSHYLSQCWLSFISPYGVTRPQLLNTLRPRQNGRHFQDDSFKCFFLNGNVWISIEVSLKFVPNGPINNIPALVQIMAWRWPGVKPLSESMMVGSPTHTCVTRPQWVLRSFDITTTKPNTTKSCAYFTGHTLYKRIDPCLWKFLNQCFLFSIQTHFISLSYQQD